MLISVTGKNKRAIEDHFDANIELETMLRAKGTHHGDNREFFAETFSRCKYSEIDIDVEFVQDNHSLSREVGMLCGLHFQAPPHAQAK